MRVWPALLFLLLLVGGHVLGQSAPVSPDQPWHSADEQKTASAAKPFLAPGFSIEPDRTYSLAELVDMAEAHNPETRVAWERARAQMAALGIARSELYPTIAAVALSQTLREETFFGTVFYRQTIQTFATTFDLRYTIFDFGARNGRIAAARAGLLAANFVFNDIHRQIIYQVAEAYYQLLNASGQVEASQASLNNAVAVQQAAEDRLKNGLATLPDVLEARSATAQAQFDLQAAIGAEQIARGDLATALGSRATAVIHVQPIDQLVIPESIGDSADQAIDRALAQRPDLMRDVAEIRKANAAIKEARAAFYPALTVSTNPILQSLYGLQQTQPWTNTADLAGSVTLNLRWTIFDGGARRNNLAQAEANARAAKAQTMVARDQIADQVWRAYSNATTAFRQRQAAAALLMAADQSYAAALEAYNDGVRSLLDVTAAQAVAAHARSADVLARAQVLKDMADLSFGTADLIQSSARRPQP
jgi:outer membrane protein